MTRHTHHCYFCGAPTTFTVRVEDGCPFYHPDFFDTGGRVAVCRDYQDTTSKCVLAANRLRAENRATKAAAAKKRADAYAAEKADWDAYLSERDALTTSLTATGYGPRILASDLVGVARHVGHHHGRTHAIYEHPKISGAYLEIDHTIWGITHWVADADELRLAWARDHDVTHEARRDVRFVGLDQLRMYELVDHRSYQGRRVALGVDGVVGIDRFDGCECEDFCECEVAS